MAEQDPDQILRDMAERACALVGADRCTLFQFDRARNEVFSRVALGLEEEIRLPTTRGVIGFVARTGRSLRLRDAYNDPRFDPSVDQRTGYRTRSILCVPVTGSRGQVIGAVQVINKVSGYFSEDDEEQLQRIAAEAAAFLAPR